MVRAALLLALVGHSILTVRSWATFGYAGFFPPFPAENTTQIFSDLCIALSLAHAAIALDIRRRGDSALLNLPFFLGTLLSGSFSPLLYFLWRPAMLEALFSAGPPGEDR